MDPTIRMDVIVDVVPIFKGRASELNVCVPWKMKWGGKEVVFEKLGMRHPTSKGKRLIHVFEVSDGTNDYRLEFDAERLTWRLVSMMEGAR
jgi:hypothetical protein